MDLRRNQALPVVALLALAGLVCLGVALRLLGAAEEGTGLDGTRLALALGLAGGLVVFLLGLGALLVARRLALGPRENAAHPPLVAELDIREIRTWGDELAAVSDRLREDVPEPAPEVQTAVLEVPGWWRPEGKYLVDTPGAHSDPLADLKATRDQLVEAADRVDSIVESIRALDSNDRRTTPSSKSPSRRRWWWPFGPKSL